MDGLLSSLNLTRPRSILRGTVRQSRSPSPSRSVGMSVLRETVVKLLVVGDRSVGKSSLVAAFLRAAPTLPSSAGGGTGSGSSGTGASSSSGAGAGQSATSSSDNDTISVMPTVGVEVTRVQLDTSVFVELWEVPIQELRSDVASHRNLWFDGLHGAVMVFDSGNPVSLEAVDEWRDALASLPVSHTSLYLVCHKWDTDVTGLTPVDLDAYCAAAGVCGWKTTSMRGEAGVRSCGNAVAEAATAAVGRARASGLMSGGVAHMLSSQSASPTTPSSPKSNHVGQSFTPSMASLSPTVSPLGLRMAAHDRAGDTTTTTRVVARKPNTFATGVWHRSQASSASDLVPSIGRMLGYENPHSTPSSTSTPTPSPVPPVSSEDLAPTVAVVHTDLSPPLPSEAVHGLCPRLLPSTSSASVVVVGMSVPVSDPDTTTDVFGPQPPAPFLSPLLTLPDGSSSAPSPAHCDDACEALTVWADSFFGFLATASAGLSPDTAPGVHDQMDKQHKQLLVKLRSSSSAHTPADQRLGYLEELRRLCIRMQVEWAEALHATGSVGAGERSTTGESE